MPSYLFIISSSSQMYSGTGTAIFDWIRFAKSDFKFSFLMDTFNNLNYKITKDFCDKHGITLFSSRPFLVMGCIDSGIDEISNHLNSHYYDFIECVSWANAATNLEVISSKNCYTNLIYTPHTQPMWTLHDYNNKYFMVTPSFENMLQNADLIFIDSFAESKLLPPEIIRNQDKVHCVPLGVDTEIYMPETSSVKDFQILCVCDCREGRKRIDLLLESFIHAYRLDNRLNLVIVGKGSDTIVIPKEIQNSVNVVGYIEISRLVELYQTSALFVLLTDYEAFGLPIAEALCCGCPVLLNRLGVLEDIFAALPGVTFVNNTDIANTAKLIKDLAGTSFDRLNIAFHANNKFSFQNTYGRKRALILSKLKRAN